MDPGLGNTEICTSRITFMDGEKGILRYRGIPVEELAEHSTFVETAYLLINGTLPTRKQLNNFSVQLNDQSLVHEDMKGFYQNFPPRSHPMGILSSMVNTLESFYPILKTPKTREEEINITLTRLISKVRTMAAMSYKMSRGHKVVYPRPDLCYCGNFLNMMFDSPVRPYQLDENAIKALNVFWILHDVDFYSGIVLRTLGIPTNMFTVMFALGRMPGWIAQWKEDADNPKWRLYRPRQIYTGNKTNHYVSIGERA